MSTRKESQQQLVPALCQLWLCVMAAGELLWVFLWHQKSGSVCTLKQLGGGSLSGLSSRLEEGAAGNILLCP